MLTFKSTFIQATIIALTFSLYGCADAPNPLTGLTPIPRAVTVNAGEVAVVIAAPPGFCVDRATIDENPRGAFMFLSDCHTNSSTGQVARTPISAILTASISPTGMVGRESGVKPALSALGAFLASPVGLFSMGKSNVDRAVKILKAKQSDVALYLLVQDSAFQDDAGASNRYWRAFSEINGRLVALSVTGYTKNDPDEARALLIIRAFMQQILDANANAA